MVRKFDKVHQFRITLEDTNPPVWRRIRVPEDYSFWDLHVAIQDSMGWQDCHLHLFRVIHPVKGVGEIGIPSTDDEDFGRIVLPGWEEKVSGWLSPERNRADYEYDFGDGWRHSVILEQVLPREKGVKYPRCIEGKRACPPEDCGGVPGYEQVCKGKLREHFPGYDPERWDPAFVRFADPKRRLKRLLDSMSAH